MPVIWNTYRRTASSVSNSHSFSSPAVEYLEGNRSTVVAGEVLLRAERERKDADGVDRRFGGSKRDGWVALFRGVGRVGKEVR